MVILVAAFATSMRAYVAAQWVVTDPQGFDTTIAVSNLDSKSKPDPTLFKIDYTQYRN